MSHRFVFANADFQKVLNPNSRLDPASDAITELTEGSGAWPCNVVTSILLQTRFMASVPSAGIGFAQSGVRYADVVDHSLLTNLNSFQTLFQRTLVSIDRPEDLVVLCCSGGHDRREELHWSCARWWRTPEK